MNADGDVVGYTVTESPWDDQARAEAEALWEADQMLCLQCGNPREDCADPSGEWFPQRHVCYASRERSVAESRYDAKHEAQPFHDGSERGWVKEWSTKAPFHFRDGVRVYVAPYDVNPDDGFI